MGWPANASSDEPVIADTRAIIDALLAAEDHQLLHAIDSFLERSVHHLLIGLWIGGEVHGFLSGELLVTIVRKERRERCHEF